jgi:ABC-type antimicrobial peptide transport system permease subunit
MKLKNAIGQTVTTWRQQKKTIIGVVRDFQFHSMYKGVTPFFLRWQSQGNSDIYIKIKGGTEQETLAKLGRLYQQFNRGLPLEYAFLDGDYQALYASEERVSILSRYFAGIAILISCLGLFGLAAYTAQRRQKEMSIRKVVGAKASTIALLLSKDFFKLVSVALAIGIPLAAWIMHRWLESFAFRVTMGPAVFILAALVLMVITLLTISFQAIRSASVNPVRVLRSE